MCMSANKTLSHENTVVRVDTSAKAAAAQLQQKAQQGATNSSSPRPATLPGLSFCLPNLNQYSRHWTIWLMIWLKKQ
ncbi:unnamed protein product [Anisakis simplex]|uniref:Uncharacterized protein n=1 Tax=Anisakis simplex TaxID=6269 RepID=A0A0M3K9A4_ANISI|nr:unnamed protein product [Anisakis simplex]